MEAPRHCGRIGYNDLRLAVSLWHGYLKVQHLRTSVVVTLEKAFYFARGSATLHFDLALRGQKKHFRLVN